MNKSVEYTGIDYEKVLIDTWWNVNVVKGVFSQEIEMF